MWWFDILDFLKEYSFLPISVFSFLSVIAGVAFATREKLVIRRTKLEVKERIKIESHKEIIQATTDFYFAILDVKYKTALTLAKIINCLNELLMEEQKSVKDEKKIEDIKNKIINIKGEFLTKNTDSNSSFYNRTQKIQYFILLVEADLEINGEDKIIRDELNKMGNISSELWEAIETMSIIKDSTSLEEIEQLNKLLEKCDDKEEVQAISAKLAKIYMQRLN